MEESSSEDNPIKRQKVDDSFDPPPVLERSNSGYDSHSQPDVKPILRLIPFENFKSKGVMNYNAHFLNKTIMYLSGALIRAS